MGVLSECSVCLEVLKVPESSRKNVQQWHGVLIVLGGSLVFSSFFPYASKLKQILSHPWTQSRAKLPKGFTTVLSYWPSCSSHILSSDPTMYFLHNRAVLLLPFRILSLFRMNASRAEIWQCLPGCCGFSPFQTYLERVILRVGQRFQITPTGSCSNRLQQFAVLIWALEHSYLSVFLLFFVLCFLSGLEQNDQK